MGESKDISPGSDPKGPASLGKNISAVGEGVRRMVGRALDRTKKRGFQKPPPGPEPSVPTPPEGDPLLGCLLYLTAHFEHPYTAEALTAGLPLSEGRMPPSLFVKAAERAGLEALASEEPLDKALDAASPVVLILKGERACVLLGAGRNGSCRVVMPESPGTVEEVDGKTLSGDYAGYAIFVQSRGRETLERSGKQPDRAEHWFWGAIYQDSWSYAQIALATLMTNIFALASALFVMNVYDRVLPNNALDSLWVMAIGVGTVFLFDFILKNLRGYFLDVTGKKVDVQLANRLFDKVLNMKLAARPASSGVFANTLREVETLRDFFTSATLISIVDVPFIFIFILVFWYIGGPIALILVVALPLIFLYGLLIHYPMASSVNKNVQDGHLKHGVLFETLSGLETIKSMRGEARMRRKWLTLVQESARSGVRSRFLTLLVMNLTAVTHQIAYVIIIVIGVYLIKEGEMTMGALVACSILAGRAMAPLAQIAQLLTRLHHALTSYRSLDKIMNDPEERPKDMQFVHRPDLKGEVTFKGVGFTYPGAKVPALREVSFTIRPGEKVGLIGRTGSGKTTVAKLILGLFEPDVGTVLMDRADMRQIDPVDLRNTVGSVLQDVFLFRGTMRENITFSFPQADDQAVLHAARIGGVDDFVAAHPLGYDMPIGERGEGLSGGQRQTVAIARAVLAKPRFFLLDEPTNAMDSQSEEAFKTRFKGELGERTLLLITHKSSLLDLVDRLIVLDMGKVVADGPKNAVLEAFRANKVARVPAGQNPLEAG